MSGRARAGPDGDRADPTGRADGTARPDRADREGSRDTSESPRHLWFLAVSPTIWAVHFMACYLTAAIWCAKAGRDAGLGGVRWAVAGFTVAALVGIGLTGLRGLRRHRIGSAAVPHDFDTSEDRTRFLGFATVLLSGLSAVAVLYVALPALFIGACY